MKKRFISVFFTMVVIVFLFLPNSGYAKSYLPFGIMKDESFEDTINILVPLFGQGKYEKVGSLDVDCYDILPVDITLLGFPVKAISIVKSEDEETFDYIHFILADAYTEYSFNNFMKMIKYFDTECGQRRNKGYYRTDISLNGEIENISINDDEKGFKQYFLNDNIDCNVMVSWETITLVFLKTAGEGITIQLLINNPIF